MFFESCGAHGNVLDFVAAMEHCSVREAAVKLSEWFNIGECAESLRQTEVIDAQREIKKGIYRDKHGRLYEVIAHALSAEDFEAFIVYRELFNNYQYWVASPTAFTLDEPTEQSPFALAKEL